MKFLLYHQMSESFSMQRTMGSTDSEIDEVKVCSSHFVSFRFG
jgi:hypothetical protein